jgi:hypothetical protein
MGLFDIFKRDDKEIKVLKTPEDSVKLIEIGTTGTEIYAGYIDEEYLQELQGTEWAKKIDMMYRSETNVSMIVNALVLPLKSANWFFSAIDDSPEAEMQKRLLEKAFFEDIDKSFTMLLGEILSCVRHGYSLFDVTHQVKFDDEEMGTYNTLKSIGFRSQKTIENCDITNILLSAKEGSNLEELKRTFAIDPLNARALALLAARNSRGKSTYATTLHDAKLDRVALLRHQIDELADALMYSLALLATFEEAG